MSVSKTWLQAVALRAPATGWTDRSLLAWAAPQQDGGVPANVAITRDERCGPSDPPGESLEDYALRQGHMLANSLPGFAARLPTPLAGSTERACDTLFTWRSGAVSLTQWVVWISMRDGSVLTFAATAESSQFESNWAVFNAALRSMHIDPAGFQVAT